MTAPYGARVPSMRGITQPWDRVPARTGLTNPYDTDGGAQGSAVTGTRLRDPSGKGGDWAPAGGWSDNYGNRKVYQTGMYDPSDPSAQYGADGQDLSESGGHNAANLWQGEYSSLGDLRNQQAQKAQQAVGSRVKADAAASAMPGPYQAPSAWQAPGTMPAPYQAGAYQAPDAWQNPTAMPGSYAGNGARSALPTVGDIGQDASSLAATLRGASGNTPVTADSVGGGGAAFYDYAKGASNQLLDALKTQVGSLTNTAAGRGRIGSGYYDNDVGTLSRNLASDSENNILTHALDAASLDQSAAVGNADRHLSADEYNSGQGQQYALSGLSAAENARLGLASLDQGDYSTDQNFGLQKQGQDYSQAADQRNFSRSSYDDDRNFGRSTYESDRAYGQGQQAQDYSQAADARNFSRSSYDDDRNFGSQQQQTDYGQAADQRNYAQGQYQFDENDANQGENAYLNQLNYNNGMYYNQQQQAAANRGPSVGSVLGGIGGSLLGSALGPVGTALGGKIGSSLFGKSPQTQTTGAAAGGYAQQYGYSPYQAPAPSGYDPYGSYGTDEDEEQYYYPNYSGGGY